MGVAAMGERNVVVMAVCLGVALVGFLGSVFVLKPTGAAATAGEGVPITVPASPVTRAAVPAAMASLLPPVALPIPPRPAPSRTTGWKDIFAGGPARQPRQEPLKPVRWPEVTVYSVPTVNMTKDHHRVGTPGTAIERTVDAPPGRYAGWLYNSNGQVAAIFEDRDGNARAVRVGDEIEEYRVQVITRDALILVDGRGRERRVVMQGRE
jgi:hypothetical protein